MNNIPLKINQIEKSFSTRTILKDISLEILPSEIYGLVGANGIGKTTLIKIILQLLNQSKGEVEIFGESNLLSNSRKKLAYLPEKFQPSHLLKGREFLSLACSWYGQKLDLTRLKKNCQILDLDESVLDFKVNKYSKGMVQKLGLLSVFLLDVPLLILDEPMSGLDPVARIRLKMLLKDYKLQGNSVFFSTHILSDVEEICDRMAIINHSSIVYQGTPKDLLKQYKESSLETAFLKIVGEKVKID